jgi:hypothetical protein
MYYALTTARGTVGKLNISEDFSEGFLEGVCGIGGRKLVESLTDCNRSDTTIRLGDGDESAEEHGGGAFEFTIDDLGHSTAKKFFAFRVIKEEFQHRHCLSGATWRGFTVE